MLFSLLSVTMAAWRSGNGVDRINSYSTSNPVSTGMGDVSGFNSRRLHFISVCNQPPKANLAFHPFGVDR